MTRRAKLIALLIVLVASACEGPDLVPPPPNPVPAVQMRWTSRGPAQFSSRPERDELAGGPGFTSPDLSDREQTLEELASELRPVMLYDGREYEGNWEDSLALARVVIEKRRLRRAGMPPRDPTNPSVEERRQAVVIGQDNRADISNSADQDPFRYIGLLDFGSGGKYRYCTLFKVINHATAATAAHCVHGGAGSGKSWLPVGRITFKPTAQNPMQMLDPAVHPYAIVVPSGWINGDRHAWDFAVIRFRGAIDPASIDAQQTPNATIRPTVPGEFFDMGPNEFAKLGAIPWDVNGPLFQFVPGTYFIAGFPVRGPEGSPVADYPPACANKWPCLVYDDSNQVVLSYYATRRLWYTIDTTGGQSGSPVFRESTIGVGAPAHVLAIHNGSDQDFLGDTVNRGVIITESVEQWLTIAGGGQATVYTD
jgi:hypothetical protein